MGIRTLLLGAVMGTLAWGADPFAATWKLRAPTSPLESSILQITANGMTHRLAYRMTYAASANVAPVVETFISNLDGKESIAILGNGASAPAVKMALTRIDERHWTAIVRSGGQVTTSSKAEVSADGKVLKIENAARSADGKTQASTQFWDRQ
jgi:hypothetical protein